MGGLTRITSGGNAGTASLKRSSGSGLTNFVLVWIVADHGLAFFKMGEEGSSFFKPGEDGSSINGLNDTLQGAYFLSCFGDGMVMRLCLSLSCINKRILPIVRDRPYFKHNAILCISMLMDVSRGTAYGLGLSQVAITLGIVLYFPAVRVSSFSMSVMDTGNHTSNGELVLESLQSHHYVMGLPMLACSFLAAMFTTNTLQLFDNEGETGMQARPALVCVLTSLGGGMTCFFGLAGLSLGHYGPSRDVGPVILGVYVSRAWDGCHDVDHAHERVWHGVIHVFSGVFPA